MITQIYIHRWTHIIHCLTSPSQIHSLQLQLPHNNNSHQMNSPATKFRLMCSHGGHILPRPHDKTLCYVGGETHIITMDRHTTVQNLSTRITKTFIKHSSSCMPSTPSFSIKYQLPTEDLDSLITITSDDDLENMFDEYERLYSSNSSKRIRLFVFPVGRVGVELEIYKSGEWFLNALNGTSSGFSDTSSLVNCLLGLDDEKKDGNCRSAIDVNSIPGSPMMETTSSSFGSGNSIGQLKGGGIGIEEQFAQLVMAAAPAVGSGSPGNSSSKMVGLENSDPFLFYGDRSEQKVSAGFDFASPDSVLSDFTISGQLSPVAPLIQVQSSNSNNQPVDSNDSSDQNTRIQQQQQIQNPAYLLSMPRTQIDTQRPQLHHQQMQYIQPIQYMHHHHPSGAVPVSSYYQQYPHQPQTNQQDFVCYMPARQPPQGYNYTLQQPQPTHADAQPVSATPNNQAAYRTTNSGGPQLVRILSGRQNQNQYVGYSEIHHPSQPQYSQDR